MSGLAHAAAIWKMVALARTHGLCLQALSVTRFWCDYLNAIWRPLSQKVSAEQLDGILSNMLLDAVLLSSDLWCRSGCKLQILRRASFKHYIERWFCGLCWYLFSGNGFDLLYGHPSSIELADATGFWLTWRTDDDVWQWFSNSLKLCI